MELIEEKNYCLNCKNKPCSTSGCPLGNDIPGFIKAENDKTAFEILCKTTVLPAICGRICPKSRYCQANCIRGIKHAPVEIGKLEQHIGDISIKNNYKIPKYIDEEKTPKLAEKKVAVIGSGPAGLTCAAFLAMKGIQVTIYEKNKKLGGILQYGIPSFRLDKKIVDESIKKILDLGIEAKTEKELGKDFTIEQLAKEYDAVFVSIGASKPKKILEGENILSGNLLLDKIQKNEEVPNFKDKKIIVYGGGNVAIDVSRTLKRLGADVCIVYRRNVEQMPAEFNEIKEAQNEGIKIIEKTNIIEFKDGKANCIKTKLVEIVEENGNANEQINTTNEEIKNNKPINTINEDTKNNKPINTINENIKNNIKILLQQKNMKRNKTRVENIEGSNFEIEANYIILATGSQADQELLNKQGIETDKKGFIKIDDYNRTSLKNVYAGGDVVGEEATVTYAARSGRETANYITQMLQKNNTSVI
jgi:glutamate synthase (NADPH/NADH) small chain